MTEYRIVELHRQYHIEESVNDKPWREVVLPNVPRFFDSLADARSWVATIKRGVVYHDAEDAPNLAQDERKAEGDTSDSIKPLEWFFERKGKKLLWSGMGWNGDGILINAGMDCLAVYDMQTRYGFRYSDPI